jgi:hypothetical protein
MIFAVFLFTRNSDPYRILQSIEEAEEIIELLRLEKKKAYWTELDLDLLYNLCQSPIDKSSSLLDHERESLGITIYHD